MPPLPSDYRQRVYSGWLGKCIGVRFGAPLEGWSYQQIRENIGSPDWYIDSQPDKVFKPDDDTALPMILIRTLEDSGASPHITVKQLSESWLNYLGDQRGTLWWGGYGISTEHTAYINLAAGIPAPLSGSKALNGAVVAEEIGGQIFSDIWGLVAPGDPALAASLAERASSISHDGNGIHGGRFIAALVSHAFGEADPLALIKAGLANIPEDSEYARVVTAVVDFHRRHPNDWRSCFALLEERFGYHRFPGKVPIIPNAGVVAMALTYGEGDFTRTLRIANSAGWDTDCNVGNAGAIIGVAAGLAGIEEHWRTPLNDLLITASVIGSRNITTIPQCADLIYRLGCEMAGEPPPPTPRFHFHYPGSSNNFQARATGGRVISLRQADDVAGRAVLRVGIRKLGKKGVIRVFTRTYYSEAELSGSYYATPCSPTIYPGQVITARLYLPDDAPARLHARLYVHDGYRDLDHSSPGQLLTPGEWHTLDYRIPALDDVCLSEVGIQLLNASSILWEAGSFSIETLDWGGTPHYHSKFLHARPDAGGIGQWTHLRGHWRLEERAYHGSGVGYCESYSGDPSWRDYLFQAQLIPLAGEAHHINVRVQGARRSYAFGLAPDDTVTLYKNNLGRYQAVASSEFPWHRGESQFLSVAAQGPVFLATARNENGKCTLKWRDESDPYIRGQIGLSVWNGSHARFTGIAVKPLENNL